MYDDPFELNVLCLLALHSIVLEYKMQTPHHLRQEFVQLDKILQLLAVASDLEHLVVRLVSDSNDSVVVSRMKRERQELVTEVRPCRVAWFDVLSFEGCVDRWERILLRIGEVLEFLVFIH